MRFPRKKIVLALAGAGFGGAALLSAAPAAAQQDIRVEITGSNIRRVETEGALPVQVITRQDIERSGAVTAFDLLQQISANNSIGNLGPANGEGLATYGAVNASLRGLGGARTLVLINGKRLANFAGDGTAVNLTAIPYQAVDRVEILKDGASAVYGSDAIAGVINFILKQDFSGVQAYAYYGNSTRSGGSPYVAEGAATIGWGDLRKDKFNIFLSLDYQQSQQLLAKDRDFSSTSTIEDIGLVGTSGNTFPANTGTPASVSRVDNATPLPGANTGTYNPGFPNNCAPSEAGRPADFFPHRCRFDPAQNGLTDLPYSKQFSLYSAGSWQFADDWQAYFNLSYTENKTTVRLQPNPISDQFALPEVNPVFAQYNGWNQFLLQPSSPYYQTALNALPAATAAAVNGQPINVRYRAVEFGNRDYTDTMPYTQGVLGVKGTKWGWDWDGWFNYNESKVTEHLNGGFPLASRILPLLNSGVVNPFGPSPASVQPLIQSTLTTEDSLNSSLKAYGATFKGTGDIYKLPAGPLAMAAGLQFGRDEFDFQPSTNYQLGDIEGYGGNVLPVNQSRDVWAAYAELNVPIIKGLEGNAAVRYDHYSDAGSTTNPKFSLRWQPTKELLLRGAWGTGFRAPSLPNLYNPQTIGVGPVVSDPLRCPTTASSIDCDTQFASTFGGSKSLTPEKSSQASFGIVWEPNNVVSLSADAFWLQVKNQLLINGIGEAFILANLDKFGGLVTRGPVQPDFPDLPGPITNIEQINLNLGKIAVQGVDLNGSITTPTSTVGTFRAAISGTYYWKFNIQNPDGSWSPLISNGANSPLFTGNTSGVIPRWKHYASLTWTYGPWNATVAQTYQTSYTDYQTDLDGNERTVGSLSLWDLQASYTGFKNWNLVLGVKNVFDTNPPVTNQQQTFQVGYDPSYYDPRARFVYGSVTYAWK